MLRITALNDTANSQDDHCNIQLQKTKEAKEAEAFAVYNKALLLQQRGHHQHAEKLLRNLCDHTLLREAAKLVRDTGDDDPPQNHSGLQLLYSVHKNLASMLLHRDLLDQAMASYIQAVRIDPSEVTVWYKMGHIARQMHNYPLAKICFQQGLVCNPNHWPCLDNVITVTFALGDYLSCLEHISSGLERDPSYPKGLTLRRQALREQPSLEAITGELFVHCDVIIHSEVIEEEERTKYLTEVKRMRSMCRQLAEEEREKEQQRLTFDTPLTPFTWKNVGEQLAALYDSATSSDPPKSLAQEVDMRDYFFLDQSTLGDDGPDKTDEQHSQKEEPPPPRRVSLGAAQEGKGSAFQRAKEQEKANSSPKSLNINDLLKESALLKRLQGDAPKLSAANENPFKNSGKSANEEEDEDMDLGEAPDISLFRSEDMDINLDDISKIRLAPDFLFKADEACLDLMDIDKELADQPKGGTAGKAVELSDKAHEMSGKVAPDTDDITALDQVLESAIELELSGGLTPRKDFAASDVDARGMVDKSVRKLDSFCEEAAVSGEVNAPKRANLLSSGPKVDEIKASKRASLVSTMDTTKNSAETGALNQINIQFAAVSQQQSISQLGHSPSKLQSYPRQAHEPPKPTLISPNQTPSPAHSSPVRASHPPDEFRSPDAPMSPTKKTHSLPSSSLHSTPLQSPNKSQSKSAGTIFRTATSEFKPTAQEHQKSLMNTAEESTSISLCYKDPENQHNKFSASAASTADSSTSTKPNQTIPINDQQQHFNHPLTVSPGKTSTPHDTLHSPITRFLLSPNSSSTQYHTALESPKPSQDSLKSSTAERLNGSPPEKKRRSDMIEDIVRSHLMMDEEPLKHASTPSPQAQRSLSSDRLPHTPPPLHHTAHLLQRQALSDPVLSRDKLEALALAHYRSDQASSQSTLNLVGIPPFSNEALRQSKHQRQPYQATPKSRPLSRSSSMPGYHLPRDLTSAMTPSDSFMSSLLPQLSSLDLLLDPRFPFPQLSTTKGKPLTPQPLTSQTLTPGMFGSPLNPASFQQQMRATPLWQPFTTSSKAHTSSSAHKSHSVTSRNTPAPVLVDLTLEPEASSATDLLHMVASHTDAGQSKPDTPTSRRGAKRKAPEPHSEDWVLAQQLAKRRSTRSRATGSRTTSSKKKEAGVDYGRLMRRFLPQHLKGPVRVEEAGKGATAERSVSAPTAPTAPFQTTVKATSLQLVTTEEEDVRGWVRRSLRGHGLVDLMHSFLLQLAQRENLQWYAGLPEVYMKVFERLRTHLSIPALHLAPDDYSAPNLCKYARIVLTYRELQLDKLMAMQGLPVTPGPSTVSPGNAAMTSLGDHYEEDMLFLAAMQVREDALGVQHARFLVRVYWLKAKQHQLVGQTLDTVDCLEVTQELLTNLTSDSTETVVTLTNVSHGAIISLAEVNKQLESVKRYRSLEDTQQLYSSGDYDRVVENLLVTFTQPGHVTLERSSQLMLLQESLLLLGREGEAVLWGEVSVHEALGHFRRVNYNKRSEWSASLASLFASMDKVLSCQLNVLDGLGQDKLARFTQNIVAIIEINLNAPESSKEMPIDSVDPWKVLYRVLKYEELKVKGDGQGQGHVTQVTGGQGETQEPSPSQSAASEMSPSLSMLVESHELLGRRGWCTMGGGEVLLLLLQELEVELKGREEEEEDDLEMAFEQCVYCLYSHPNKRGKARHLNDHNTSPVTLTWERAGPVVTHFLPDQVPEFDSYRTNTISPEMEHLLRRVYSLVPASVHPAGHIGPLSDYMDGVMTSAPTLSSLDSSVTCDPYHLAKVIFYLLGDFYFKNKEPAKAVKFYQLDVVVCPSRVDAWAGLALAKMSQLQQKLGSNELKLDTPLNKKSDCALRCFRRAVDIEAGNHKLWVEYGSLAYMLHSHASQQVHLGKDLSISEETLQGAGRRKAEMLALARANYGQASRCEETEEDWLTHYMLGKVAEKLREPSTVALDCYTQAVQCLHEEGATYPRRIAFVSQPPHLALEALELCYRVMSVVSKALLSHGQSHDLSTSQLASLEAHVDAALGGHFAKGEEKKRQHSARDSSASEAPLPAKHVYHRAPADHEYSRYKSLSDSQSSDMGEEHLAGPPLGMDSLDNRAAGCPLLSGLPKKSYAKSNQHLADSESKTVLTDDVDNVRNTDPGPTVLSVDIVSDTTVTSKPLYTLKTLNDAPGTSTNSSEISKVISGNTCSINENKMVEDTENKVCEKSVIDDAENILKRLTETKTDHSSDQSAERMEVDEETNKECDKDKDGQREDYEGSQADSQTDSAEEDMWTGNEADIDSDGLEGLRGGQGAEVSNSKVISAVVEVHTGEDKDGQKSDIDVQKSDTYGQKSDTDGQKSDKAEEGQCVVRLMEEDVRGSRQGQEVMARARGVSIPESDGFSPQADSEKMLNEDNLFPSIQSQSVLNTKSANPQPSAVCLNRDIKVDVEDKVELKSIPSDKLDNREKTDNREKAVNRESCTSENDSKPTNNDDMSSSQIPIEVEKRDGDLQDNKCSESKAEITDMEVKSKQRMLSPLQTESDKKDENREKWETEDKEKPVDVSFSSTKKPHEINSNVQNLQTSTEGSSSAMSTEPDCNLPERCARLMAKVICGLELCLARFPAHHKSQYRLAHIYLHAPSHQHTAWARDLLMGRGDWREATHMPAPGLFSSKNNLFQGWWRSPCDDIERPGSFPSHARRTVALLLDVLGAEGDIDALRVVRSQLRRVPDAGKKYLRDAERLALAEQAVGECVKVVGREMDRGGRWMEAEIEANLRQVYRVYLAARGGSQEDGASVVLHRAFRMMMKGRTDITRLTAAQAVAYCQQNLAKAPSTPALARPGGSNTPIAVNSGSVVDLTLTTQVTSDKPSAASQLPICTTTPKGIPSQAGVDFKTSERAALQGNNSKKTPSVMKSQEKDLPNSVSVAVQKTFGPRPTATLVSLDMIGSENTAAKSSISKFDKSLKYSVHDLVSCLDPTTGQFHPEEFVGPSKNSGSNTATAKVNLKKPVNILKVIDERKMDIIDLVSSDLNLTSSQSDRGKGGYTMGQDDSIIILDSDDD